VVREYASVMRAVNIRKAEIERAQTIKVARALHRMRTDPDQRWHDASGGGKSNDHAFCEWAAAEMEQGFHPTYVWQLLSAGYVLPALENSVNTILPGTAGQIVRLAGLRKLKPLPGVKAGADVMVEIWEEAVEESGGRQPSQAVVESKVRAWRKARKAVVTGDLDGSGEVRAHIRMLGEELKKLYEKDPAAVRAAIASWGMAFR
jgi:hypothetical protein